MKNRKILLQLDDKSIPKLKSYFEQCYPFSNGNTVDELCNILALHSTDVPGNYNIDATITFDFSRIPEKKVEVTESKLDKIMEVADKTQKCHDNFIKLDYLKWALGLDD